MSSTDPVLERFARLPLPMQRAIESALLGVGPVAPGTTIDAVQRARLASLVAAAEGELAAQTPAPASSTRVTARTASPSSPWFPSTAPRSAPPPAAAPRAAALPEDLHAALAVAADHVDVAARMGASQEKCNAILRGYLTTLWKRPSTRATLERYEHLVALFDLRHGSGRR